LAGAAGFTSAFFSSFLAGALAAGAAGFASALGAGVCARAAVVAKRAAIVRIVVFIFFSNG
jgi:hypothetical protein